jgi:hypothetical protein
MRVGFERKRLTVTFGVLVLLAGGIGTRLDAAQPEGSDPAALAVLREAVAAEFEADRTDKSIWTYRESDVTDSRNAVYDTIETAQGSLRRMIELNGKPLGAQATGNETRRIENYVHDPAAQARSQHASQHDDAQAAELLKMLPDAFIWTMAGEDQEFIKLTYRPNPAFNPPDMQSRVMGVMAGEMLITRNEHRIRTLRGALSEDVKFGFGILGKLDAGGTFDVERRMVGDNHWQITETHVHIGGHALLFKTIGQQEDDTKSDWRPSTAPNLEVAEQQITR